MDRINFSDLPLLKVGTEIAMWGAVYTGLGRAYLVPFPDADVTEIDGEPALLQMSAEDWAIFLHQTDVVDVELPTKAIVRKSQRRIDSVMQWAVWERDGYRCRYCGEKKPLTVDHVDLWEDGGATLPANLISACGPCNKARGRTPYAEWVVSKEYLRRAARLPDNARAANLWVAQQVEDLKALRVSTERSR